MCLVVSLLAMSAFDLTESIKGTKYDIFHKIETKRLWFKYEGLKIKITKKSQIWINKINLLSFLLLNLKDKNQWVFFY